MEIRKTYKFRLYPTKKQVEALEQNLYVCRTLYNAALQERRESYEYWKKYNHYITGDYTEKPKVNKYSQNKEFTGLLEAIPELREYNSHMLRYEINKLEETFQAFFRRVKAGETPGYPRFKSKARFDSFTFPDAHTAGLDDDKDTGPGWSWDKCANRLVLAKCGGSAKLSIKMVKHRLSPGRVCLLTIKREAGNKWYACFSVVTEKPEQHEIVTSPVNPVGVDRGLKIYAGLSNGKVIPRTKFFKSSEKKLKKAQRIVSRRKLRSNGWHRAQEKIRTLHKKIVNQRKDFLHFYSKKLARRYDLIAMEDLKITNMVRRPKAKPGEKPGEFLPNRASQKAGLNKSILDAAWGMFAQFTHYKAVEAGGRVIKVDPKYTSQVCSDCGVKAAEKTPMSGDRLFRCQHCGLVLDRDINAAINIRTKGLLEALHGACQSASDEMPSTEALVVESTPRPKKAAKSLVREPVATKPPPKASRRSKSTEKPKLERQGHGGSKPLAAQLSFAF